MSEQNKEHFTSGPEQQRILDKYFNFSADSLNRPRSTDWIKRFEKSQKKCSIELILSYLPTMDEDTKRRAIWAMEQLKN